MATISVRAVGGGAWTDLPEPDGDGGFSIGIQDVDASSTGRDSTGLMHRDRVAIKRKLNCTWSNRTPTVISTILNSPIKNVFFECQYTDPQTNATATGVFYCGDANTSYYNLNILSLTRNFIER